MNIKRGLATLAIAALSLTSLAACGSDTAQDEEKPDSLSFWYYEEDDAGQTQAEEDHLQPRVGPQGADAAHPLQADHQPALGHRAADQPGVAADRHHRQTRRRRQPDAGRHLGRRSRPHHGQRRAVILPHPVARKPRRVGPGQQMACPDDIRQIAKNSHISPARRSPAFILVKILSGGPGGRRPPGVCQTSHGLTGPSIP